MTLTPPIDRILLRLGVLAGPLFAALALIGSIPRDRYSSMKHPVSSLAFGPLGWLQVLNFVGCGLLVLGFALGLFRSLRAEGKPNRWGPLLVGAWGCGLIGAGVFLTDPVNGYPVGTSAVTTGPTWHGIAHDGLSMVGFAGVIAACGVFTGRFARRHRTGWALYCAASGMLIAAGLVTSSQGFAQDPRLVGIAGLLQRTCVGLIWIWLAALALRQLRASRPAT